MSTATLPTVDTPIHPEPHVLQCMEVWGGSQAVASSVQLSGLDAWGDVAPSKSAPEQG